MLLSACTSDVGPGDLADLGDAACVPQCDLVQCGPDGCGGLCGVCPTYATCIDHLCQTDQVEIPAGPFVRGCKPASDGQCREVEQPETTVVLGSYRIDIFEVGVQDYRQCVMAGQCSEPGTGDYCNWGEMDRVDHPINCVTWQQAQGYCEWAGRRLCTEAEWEKAARGSQGGTYPWGQQEPQCRHASFGGPEGVCGDAGTSPRASHKDGISPFGVLDAAGNVWEWVSDWYDGASYGEGGELDGPAAGEFKVIRGGSFASPATELRCAHRYAQRPDQMAVGLGFRCCR